MPTTEYPATIQSEAELEDLLSDPSEAALAAAAQLKGDALILGAGGKMGLSLARMLQRASQQAGVSRRILCVSRFTTPGRAEAFAAHGLEIMSGDLLDDAFLDQLPQSPLVILMTGMKFGTGAEAARTWAMNVDLPSQVGRHFRDSRLLAFSTGNVYPLVPVGGGGSQEGDALQPVGEYGMTALGRERILEYHSRRAGIPIAIVRLNYAVEMRYGVLCDLAQQVAREQPIDLSMGSANVIWQGDANAMALAAWADATSPPSVVNVAGPEIFEIASVCEQLASHLRKPVHFRGRPAETALLNNGQRAHARYGRPRVALDQLLRWTADWIAHGRPTWNKPTHFQTRDGRF